MKDFEQIEIESRDDLRAWLEANHTRSESIWLVRHIEHAQGKHVTWDEVVEEALCFGWIDSMPRKLDADRTMLLLSPRLPGSPWSHLYQQRVEKLLASGLIAPAGLAVIERAKRDGSWSVHDEAEELIIPPDLAAALAQERRAAQNFHAFSSPTVQGILWWIKNAKQPATRQKRIADTVRLAVYNTHIDFQEECQFEAQP